MEIPLLRDLVLVFGLCIAVVVLFHRLKLPPTVGFLLTGVLAGPNALGLVSDLREVEALAEVGVVLLLFTVGVEISLKELCRLRHLLLLGGAGQVALTVAFGLLLALVFGFSFSQGVFLGFMIALSSTAGVLKLLSDRAETSSPHGSLTLSILIFQDLAVVPMLLLVPLLAGQDAGLYAAGGALLRSLGVVAGILLLARFLVPRFLYLVVRTGSRELFVMSVIVLLLGTAEITALAGLSLALGAFLAGLVISESEYSHHALGEILPFRDALSSIFFVSVGMLFDIGLLEDRPLALLGFLALILLGKAAIVASMTRLLGYPFRVALRSGLLIAQLGEFSFVLYQVGKPVGLVPSELDSLFMATAVLSMALTPALAALGRWIVQAPEPGGAPGPGEGELRNHVLVVGFGLCGRNQVRALDLAGIPYRIIEMNPQVVREEAKRGRPILLGDSTRPLVLEESGILSAKVMVVAISDPSAAKRTVEMARKLNAALHIIVRTPFLSEMETLLELGANEVVPEDLESSIELFCRTLSYYMVPKEDVDAVIRTSRSEGYGALKIPGEGEERRSFARTLFPGLAVEVQRVGPDSRMDGRTLEECGLREEAGLLVLAVLDGETVKGHPRADFRLEAGMAVVVMGSPEELREGSSWFRARTMVPTTS